MVKREQKVAEALATMAHPKTWPLSNGALLDVHTPATTKYAALHCVLWRPLYSTVLYYDEMQAPAFSELPAKVLCMTKCSICVEGNDAQKCSCSFALNIRASAETCISSTFGDETRCVGARLASCWLCLYAGLTCKI